MPGIHVRTPDKFDWIYREKEPLLTVPGSYWLCHKKSIYKFTFKYHRQSKDSKQFHYGKELMKVIRRIIKSQPRQGQQFGTRHLLVTYNHSSWTRQDKMFAMLKFRERTNATAFSRAFVLTVKLVPTNSNYQNETEFDDDLVEFSSNEKSSKWSEIIKKQYFKESINTLQNITTREKECNNSTKCQLTCSNDIRDGIKTLLPNSIENNGPSKEVSVTLFPGIDNSPLVERCIPEQDSSRTKHTINNKAETLNEIQESIDMPYQYLIEREIERTNSQGSEISNVQSLLPGNTMEEKSARDSHESTVFRAKSVSSSNIIDNASSRSANITDLVMEGLMFTISQNQDSITVLEQKTKSEPDEVLENSEKAETIEGSKLLINSSLFKLENLITKIDMSNNSYGVSEHGRNHKTTFLSNVFNRNDLMKKENDNKSSTELNGGKSSDDTAINIVPNECNEKSTENVFKSTSCQLLVNSLQTEKSAVPLLNNLSNRIIHDEIQSQFACENSLDFELVTEKNMLSKHTNTNILIKQTKNRNKKVKNVNVNRNIYNNDDDDDRIDDWNANDEEEIIPEALQNHQSICRKIQKNNLLTTKDDENNLLMDDIESDKESYSLHHNKLISKLHVPRVISNEAVQYDLSSLRTPKFPESNSSTTNPNTNATISCECELKTYFYQNNCESCQEIANPIRKKLTARRRLYCQKLSADNKEITIEMWKFIQDITHGAKIILQRLSL